VGAPDVTVSGVAPLDRAGPDDLSFLAAKRYLQYFQQSSAAIVLCKPDLVPDDAGAGPACRVVVRDPHVALLSVIPVLYPEPAWQPGIHRTAVIGDGVVWQEPVAIGPYAVLRPGRAPRQERAHRCRGRAGRRRGARRRRAAAAAGGVLQRHDRGQPRHSGTRVCDSARTLRLRAGEERRDAAQDSPGGSLYHRDDVEIGANTTIDRGSVDDTVVGPGTKIDNLVQIGHNCRIGARCLIAGQAGIAGSTHVEDDVFLAGQAGLADHVTIGRGARVTVQGGVIGTSHRAPPCPATGAYAPGVPAGQGALYRLAHIVDDLEALVRRTDESQP